MKIRYGIPFAIVVGMMAVAPPVLAVPQNGSTFITTPNCSLAAALMVPCEARRGTDILVHGRFMSATVSTNNYELYLSYQSWCENDSRNVAMASNLLVDANGEIPGSIAPGYTDQDSVPDVGATLHDDVRGTIPSSVSRGTYEVCFNNGQGTDTTGSSYSSSPVVLTVI